MGRFRLKNYEKTGGYNRKFDVSSARTLQGLIDASSTFQHLDTKEQAFYFSDYKSVLYAASPENLDKLLMETRKNGAYRITIQSTIANVIFEKKKKQQA